MKWNADELLRLLPSIYRVRDEQQGGPLRALLAVLAEQIAVLEDDLERRYDDQFIETCADWVIPYIGDLIGYRPRHAKGPGAPSQRAEVANTLAYRRRKGTAAALEQLARDVTGWDARAMEFFSHLATTQHLNHIRPANTSFPDLRHWETLEYVGSPFDQVPRTADVRRIATNGGKYNIPNVGIFVWRLWDYPIQRGTAFNVKEGCFTFHPLGLDAPLFTPARSEEDITHIAEPINVADPLRRRPLYEDLEAQRQAITDKVPEDEVLRRSVFFSADGAAPVWRVFVDGTEIKPSEMVVADLGDPDPAIPEFWRRPPKTRSYQPSTGGSPRNFNIRVAVDPVLGRLTLPLDAVSPKRVEVSYSYGFSGDVGGGPYARPEASASTVVEKGTGPLKAGPVPFSATATEVVTQTGKKLSAALDGLGPNSGVIEIADNATYAENLTITLGARQTLTVRAKEGVRPVLRGGISITAAEGAIVAIDGLLIGGSIDVKGNARMTLMVSHSTVAPRVGPPATAAVKWNEDKATGELVVTRTICGQLLAGQGVKVEIADTILDALGDDRPALSGSDDGLTRAGIARLVCCTVIGTVSVHELELAEHCLFTGRVEAEKKQQGCVRFCYVPLDSETPRRYQCQPESAAAAARVRPQFTSLRFGDAGYGQLSSRCAAELRRSADDSEMGAFRDLYQDRRETDLRLRLDEHLRFGLEAGIFHAT